MKSILREYIRAALVINEGNVTLSTAVQSGLRSPATTSSEQNTDLENPELVDFIAKANTVIQNNLDSYTSFAQQEIDKLDNIGFADIDSSDLIAFSNGLAATTLADSTDIDKTGFPIRTAIYLIALDQSIPTASDAIGDIATDTLSNLFSIIKIQRFGSIKENKSKNYMPFQLLGESSTATTVGSEIWKTIMAGLDNTLGTGWRTLRRGVSYLADPGDKIAINYARHLTEILSDPAEKFLQKIPKMTREACNLAIVRAVDDISIKRGDAAVAKLASNASKTAKDAARNSIILLTDDDKRRLGTEILKAIHEAAVSYAESSMSDPAKFLYNAPTEDQIKTVIKISLNNLDREMVKVAEIESIATDRAVIDYFNALIATAIKDASFLSKIAIGTTKKRLTLAIIATVFTTWCSGSLYAAIDSAGRAQPDAEIPEDDLAALLAFNNLVIKGRAATDSVASKIENSYVTNMTRLQSTALNGALVTLGDIMHRDPMLPKSAAELEDVSSKLSNEFGNQ